MNNQQPPEDIQARRRRRSFRTTHRLQLDSAGFYPSTLRGLWEPIPPVDVLEVELLDLGVTVTIPGAALLKLGRKAARNRTGKSVIGGNPYGVPGISAKMGDGTRNGRPTGRK